MNKLFRLIPLLLLISGICFFPVTSVFADDNNETDKKDINITLSPTDSLFNVSNMKPGDWVPRTITVTNSGSKDFTYQMGSQNDGETKLFNELLLEVKADEKELYQGKLADFKSLPARKLVSGSEESLDITIRFPEHLGNDFQGLGAAFIFNFTAEGNNTTPVQAATKGHIESGGPAQAGFSLPDTATNLFTLLLLGAVLMVSGIALMIVRHYSKTKPAQ
ncbi:hypothetical protein JSQ81_15520 [Sporosarcina sp. Marseille-Q4063]|uniref:hypothetical protein n=1 Tax=Sporosarcina sp. Marseille-Q4063 TaxID=2810514 RepID=UPI001BB046F4|nr:hypothetical protein [Sporosarcina sp. Marseille-Q4063]QUW21204.1 hypothetical protein JSQ81_15520 [Sporosarcina sp. Marseille-Q4063]